MLRSWLADLAVEQLEDHDGIVPMYVPFLPLLPFPQQADVGWGDAAVVVPWVLYERTGDVGLLADQWTSMTTWIDVFEKRAGADLDFPEGGFSFGDWLDTAAPPDNPAAARTPWQCVATAYLARSARMVAQAAEVLGRDGARFADLAERAAARFRAEYVTPTGRVAFPSQTAYALALEFDLLTAEQREHAGRLLAEQVLKDGFHIASGFLGTPLVTDALTNAGELATAYELLLQRENPSWLYPVTMGATTIWERWDSMLPDGSINPGDMTSFNHYAFGAVADWLHRTVAGLAPAAPGLPAAARGTPPGPGSDLRRGDARDAVRDGRGRVDAVGRDGVRPRGHRAAEHDGGGRPARRQRPGRGRLRPALVHARRSRSRCRSRSRRSSSTRTTTSDGDRRRRSDRRRRTTPSAAPSSPACRSSRR